MKPDQLDEVLPKADVVFVSAPHTEKSHKMLGPKQFDLMKNKAFFIAVSRGGLYDLNSLADLPAGWTLREAEEVNDLGQIVGWATNGQNRRTAFLLTPVPEPTGLALLLWAATVLFSRRRGRASSR